MPRRRRSQRNTRQDIPKLDLHSTKHEDARSASIRFIEAYWGDETEVHIITGFSEKMREIVIEVLGEYELSYQIGDSYNRGFISTWV